MKPEQRHIDKARYLLNEMGYSDRNVDYLAAALEEAEGRWTSVAEGLPELDEVVLIGAGKSVCAGKIAVHGFVSIPGKYTMCPTHWRVRPPGPEEE